MIIYCYKLWIDCTGMRETCLPGTGNYVYETQNVRTGGNEASVVLFLATVDFMEKRSPIGRINP
jgi:hypothetical protein